MRCVGGYGDLSSGIRLIYKSSVGGGMGLGGFKEADRNIWRKRVE